MSSSDDICVQLRRLQNENAELRRREETVNSQYGRLKELIDKVRTAEGDKARLQRELDAVKLEATKAKQARQPTKPVAVTTEQEHPMQSPQQRESHLCGDVQHDDTGVSAPASDSALPRSLQECQTDIAAVRATMKSFQEQQASDLAKLSRIQEQQQQQQLQRECRGCSALAADMHSLQASQRSSEFQIAALSQQLLSFRLLMGSFASQIAADAAPAEQLPARITAEASNSALPGLQSVSGQARQPAAVLQAANGVTRELLHGDSGTGHADAGTPRSSSSLSGSTHGAACYHPCSTNHGRPAKRTRLASAGLASGTNMSADAAQAPQHQDDAQLQTRAQAIPALAFERVDADLERILQPCISKEDTIAIAASLASAMQSDLAFLECFMAGFETALLECAELVVLHMGSASCHQEESIDEGCSTPPKLPQSGSNALLAAPLIEDQPFTLAWCNRQSCASHAVSRLIAFAAATSEVLAPNALSHDMTIVSTLRDHLHASAIHKDSSRQQVLRLAPEQCSFGAAIVGLCRQESNRAAAMAYLCDLALLHLPSCSQLLPPAAAALSVWPVILSASRQDVIAATLEALLHDLCLECAAAYPLSDDSVSAEETTVTAGSWSGSTLGQHASGQYLVKAACWEMIRLGQIHWGWCRQHFQHSQPNGTSKLHCKTAPYASNLLASFEQQTEAACSSTPLAAALCLCSRMLGWRWAITEVAASLLFILSQPSRSNMQASYAELLLSMARSAWCSDAPAEDVRMSLSEIIRDLERAYTVVTTSSSARQVGRDELGECVQSLHAILRHTMMQGSKDLC